MSDKLTKADVLTKEQAAHIDRFRLYRSAEKLSFEQALTNYYLSGLELIALQDSATHAKVDATNSFKALREAHLPEISQSDAYRRIAIAEKVKIPTMGILQDRLLLTDGQLPKKIVEAVMEEIGEHTDGKTITAVLRDLDIIRDKKPAKHHPRKPVSPEDQVESEDKSAEELANIYLQAAHTLLLDEQSIIRLKPAKKQEVLAAGIKVNEAIRKFSKTKKS